MPLRQWFELEIEYTVRAADAKEVGVGDPAEETCCNPNLL